MIHMYHGDGKGKTTAAVGLAIRMLGHGKKVYFAQCMKGGASGEVDVLLGLPGVTVRRLPREYGFYSELSRGEKDSMREEHDAILQEALSAAKQGAADLIVLDEITYPLQFDLVRRELVEELLWEASEEIEIVCTGRGPEEWMLEKADYVTEMKMEKHPFEAGMMAREGVEW